MIRRMLRREDGIALAMVLAFMVLAVPIVTAALALASTLAIDSRVKTGVLSSQYSALAGDQYGFYSLLYDTAYSSGLAVGTPDTQYITINGQTVTVTVTKLANTSGPGVPNSDNSRRLQASKTVNPTTAAPSTPTTFTYTIVVENKDDQPENLNKIIDLLPAGFTYVPGSTSGVITSNPTILGQKLTWDLAGLSIVLQPGQSRTLIFSASANLAEGNYCNEAWAEPGDQKTSSGKTAKITVGSPPNGLCSGAAVSLRKAVTPSFAPAGVATTFTYTITVESLGTSTLNLSLLRDMLPAGFTYVAGSTSGDFTTSNPNITVQSGRQRLDWSFTPKKQIPPGATRTHSFQAQANLSSGDYWNEVWGTFDEWGDPIYTWPTAMVRIMGVFDLRASDGRTSVSSEVWIGATGDYYINEWGMDQ